MEWQYTRIYVWVVDAPGPVLLWTGNFRGVAMTTAITKVNFPRTTIPEGRCLSTGVVWIASDTFDLNFIQRRIEEASQLSSNSITDRESIYILLLPNVRSEFRPCRVAFDMEPIKRDGKMWVNCNFSKSMVKMTSVLLVSRSAAVAGS